MSHNIYEHFCGIRSYAAVSPPLFPRLYAPVSEPTIFHANFPENEVSTHLLASRQLSDGIICRRDHVCFYVECVAR